MSGNHNLEVNTNQDLAKIAGLVCAIGAGGISLAYAETLTQVIAITLGAGVVAYAVGFFKKSLGLICILLGVVMTFIALAQQGVF